MAQRTIDHLSPEECHERLQDEVVGRLVFMDDDGPTALPVNYALDGESIVFRVEHGTKSRAVGQRVGFEVDHIDSAERRGWSVLVRGVCHEVPQDDIPELLRRTAGHFPSPWADGRHNTWLAVERSMVTGRQLGEEFSVPIF